MLANMQDANLDPDRRGRMAVETQPVYGEEASGSSLFGCCAPLSEAEAELRTSLNLHSVSREKARGWQIGQAAA
ncbi:hypothetical protein TWF788_002114, partial [Orbilia oligospora]